MSAIHEKSIGQLIDELSVTNLRCWFAQEDLMNEELSDKQRLEAAENAQKFNARRNALMRAIDEKLDNGFSVEKKSYE